MQKPVALVSEPVRGLIMANVENCRARSIGERAVKLALVIVALVGCGGARPAPRPSAAAAPIVVMISANAEWKALATVLPAARQKDTPYGEWVVHRLGATDLVFFHGGYGKVSAAGSTQYAIDRWRPALIVNLGTCGGFGPTRKAGDVVLANQTVIYDIYEQMGDADEAIADHAVKLDTSAWPARLRDRVAIEPIVSGDRDLFPADLDKLATKYHASVGDWESGAIAWVASHARTPVLILRGVSDVVDTSGSPAYGDAEHWQRETAKIMAALVALLEEALPELAR